MRGMLGRTERAQKDSKAIIELNTKESIDQITKVACLRSTETLPRHKLALAGKRMLFLSHVAFMVAICGAPVPFIHNFHVIAR